MKYPWINLPPGGSREAVFAGRAAGTKDGCATWLFEPLPKNAIAAMGAPLIVGDGFRIAFAQGIDWKIGQRCIVSRSADGASFKLEAMPSKAVVFSADDPAVIP